MQHRDAGPTDAVDEGRAAALKASGDEVSPDAATCPKCGKPTHVRRLREAFAAHMEFVRHAQSQPQPQPPPTTDPSPSPAGTGTGASGDQLLVGFVTQLLLEVGKEAIEAAVVRPAADWWATKGEAMMRERRERMLTSLQDGLDRHPELCVCTKDNVVFLPGGTRTVRVNKAVELLFRHDDAGLISALSS